MMDLLTRLPVELSERILALLGPRELCRCAGVSRAWYVLANSDHLWRKLCLTYHVEELSPPKPDYVETLGPGSKWKLALRSHILLTRNWKDNRYRKYRIPKGSGEEVVCCSCHGDTLALGYTNNMVQIYRVRLNCKVKLVQTLCTMVHFDTFPVQALATDSKVLIAKFSTVVIVYKRHRLKFRFSHIIYTLTQAGDILSCSNGDSIEEIVNTVDETFEGRLIGGIVDGDDTLSLSGNSVFHYVHPSGRLVVWNYDTINLVHQTMVDPHAASLSFYADQVCLSCENKVVVYDKEGSTPRLQLETGAASVNRVMSNCNIILAAVTRKDGHEEVLGWERKRGRELFRREMSVPEDCILHPTKEVIVYLLYSRRAPPHADKREIKAIDLRTNSLLWKTLVQKSHFNIIGHSFHITLGEFLIFYTPSFGIVSETCSVYNVLTGKYLYTIAEDCDILLCCDKLILLRDDHNNKVNLNVYL